MNAIFTTIFLISNFFLLIFKPETFLTSLLESATSAGALCLALLSSYAVWLGLMQVWKDSGVSEKFSKLLRPIARKIFKTDDQKTLECVCLNLSVNMLGISGAATPLGVQGARLLNNSPQAEYASAMFFVLNATSLQIIPTSVISLRTALKSADPTNILFPTVCTSLFSTLLAAILVRVFIPPKRSVHTVAFSQNRANSTAFFAKNKGAGVR